LKSHLNLKRLHGRIAQFERAGNSLRDAATRDLVLSNDSTEKIRRLNEQLLHVESNWLDPAGIPGRPWFQHLLYASRFTYAHLEFPGLTEAVEKADWKLAAQQAALLETALEKNTELLRSAKISWEKNNP
jgi:N-acetylated-alpha-linked acidic dipeptidase